MPIGLAENWLRPTLEPAKTEESEHKETKVREHDQPEPRYHNQPSASHCHL